ncbi:MAG: 2-amino-4-hydroxy-6-hydroxymethyldihydropteridine diphosphokinase, partial [Thermoanaerobaculales bacterium]|nr:2-amino-4-hydroxy-6-hydroxymethyldihydropteridine diphosphokinase [Thermoanaerobaculales bacterium]
MTRAAIALGSNLGDRLAYLRYGADSLTELGVVVSVSSLFETAPIGGPEQDAFFNAVIVIDTDLEPRRLLDELHRIAAESGRVREVHWGPRRLDLDLILFGNQRAEDGGMVVPHPRFGERRFVLDPLVEAWPEATTPEGRLVSHLLPAVIDQEVTRLGTWWPEPAGEASALVDGVGGDERPGGIGGGPDPVASSTFTSRGGWWVIAQAVLGVAVIGTAVLFDDTIEAGRWLAWVGVGMVFIGALLAGFGLLHLGVSLTPYPEPLELGNLVHGGVYRLVRHPVYGGISLGMIGLSLYELSWAGLAVATGAGAFFWLKAGFEERRLVLKYPDYQAY